jgi:lambda family phage minor tail protein L
MAYESWYVEPYYWDFGYAVGESSLQIIDDLQGISPSAIIELFELELNQEQHGVNATYYYHSGTNLKDNTAVVWNGISYTPLPIIAEGFEYSGAGQLPRPRLRVANLSGVVSGLIATLPSGIEGAKVTRVRTLARYIDAVNFPGNVSPYSPDPTAEWPREVYFIDRKANETRDVIEFELAAIFDIAGVRAPKRQCVANVCQWKYRSPECGYTGNAYFDAQDRPVGSLEFDVCGKRLNSCSLRFGQLTGAGSVTRGSNLLVMDYPFSVATGSPVQGFGVPANTTVVSCVGNVVTMSNNATQTTSFSAQGKMFDINKLTFSLLNPEVFYSTGMTLSGLGVPSGTVITNTAYNGSPAIDQNVTLAQNLDVFTIGTLVTQKTATIQAAPSNSTSSRGSAIVTGNSSRLALPNTTSLSVGLYVSGPGLSSDNFAKITAINTNTSGGGRYPTTTSYWASLNYSLPIGTSGQYSFYRADSLATQLYQFRAPSRNYVFRDSGILNFGSFPGIGTYYA